MRLLFFDFLLFLDRFDFLLFLDFLDRFDFLLFFDVLDRFDFLLFFDVLDRFATPPVFSSQRREISLDAAAKPFFWVGWASLMARRLLRSVAHVFFTNFAYADADRLGLLVRRLLDFAMCDEVSW
jgi:hypothetical protein